MIQSYPGKPQYVYCHCQAAIKKPTFEKVTSLRMHLHYKHIVALFLHINIV
jgi:hypothetical protein